MTETRSCIRGCSLYRQHLAACDDRDHCRGCLPRRAAVGLLCGPCHRRFELMLTDAPIVARWLTGNIEAQGGWGIDEVGQGKVKQHRKGGGSPAPLSVAIFDVRQLLTDRLTIWVDHHCEDAGIAGPKVHTVETDSAHLLKWLPSICWWDIVADWWEELAECMIDAHALAPWRPVARRVAGVPCPECAETNLMIFGGESDVTCASCRTLIREEHFALWERIVQGDREASA